MSCIKIENLKKSFKQISVFENTSLEIEENTIVGISGKNGSGKTTLLKLIAGFLLPDDGNIKVYDIDISSDRTLIKKLVSFSINSENGFYPYLSIYENLYFLNTIYKKNKQMLNDLIDFFELKDSLNIKYSLASSGMKIKLWLICSILKESKIILIDELTKSIDSETKQKIYDLIKNLNKEFKKTILFVSHNVEEIILLSNVWLHIENKKIIKRE